MKFPSNLFSKFLNLACRNHSQFLIYDFMSGYDTIITVEFQSTSQVLCRVYRL
jgi:hypothetical protein